MIFELITTAAIVITAVVAGYLMGRNSAGLPMSSQPKTTDQGSGILVDHDPYQEALEPDNLGKRIATL